MGIGPKGESMLGWAWEEDGEVILQMQEKDKRVETRIDEKESDRMGGTLG